LSKECGHPPKAANAAAKPSTKASATSNHTMLIKNHWMVAISGGSSSDCFINCRYTTHIPGGRSMFIAFTEYIANTKNMEGYKEVTSFASRSGCARSTCQLADEKMEMIILREVVHLQPVFNLISQSQIMNKDAEVEPVNHYCLNLYNFHCELIATAPQVNELFVLDCILNRAPELTEYTKIDDSCLLALTNTGYAAPHDTMKRL
jgi:hypothetical protein